MARGHLAFRQAGTRTAVETAYAESPLRFLTPRNHGTAAWAYTSTLGGGLVDGDRLELDIAVGPGARAFVSSQGPTRVFRSSVGCVSRDRGPGGRGRGPRPRARPDGLLRRRALHPGHRGEARARGLARPLGGALRGPRALGLHPVQQHAPGPAVPRRDLAPGPGARRARGADGTLRRHRDPAPRRSPLRRHGRGGPGGGRRRAGQPGGAMRSSRRARSAMARSCSASPRSPSSSWCTGLRHHLATLPSLLGDDPWRLDASDAA